MVMARPPAVPGAGVPVIAAWPCPVLGKRSLRGSVPDSVRMGVGSPVAVSARCIGLPMVAVVAPAAAPAGDDMTTPVRA
jgi:hypothetical protein